MSKLGRNDPCHCGSGRKYKKCHEPLEEAKAREERGLRTLADWVAFHTGALCGAVRARAEAHPAVTSAAERFFAAPPPDGPFSDPLFAHHAAFDLALDEGQPFVAEAPLDEPGEPDPRLAALRAALATTHLSLLEVVECKRGRGVRLADRLTGTETFFADAELSEQLDPMEVVLGRAIRLPDGPVLLRGFTKVAFRGRKAAVRELQAQLVADGLAEGDAEGRVAWLRRRAPEVAGRARAATSATTPAASPPGEAAPPVVSA